MDYYVISGGQLDEGVRVQVPGTAFSHIKDTCDSAATAPPLPYQAVGSARSSFLNALGTARLRIRAREHNQEIFSAMTSILTEARNGDDLFPHFPTSSTCLPDMRDVPTFHLKKWNTYYLEQFSALRW